MQQIETKVEGRTAKAEPARIFDFERDTFAFPNELVWEYRIDKATGKTTTVKNDPPPTYSLHCFVMVRAAKQFLLHARFEPSSPRLTETEYANRVRILMRRSAEHGSNDKIIIPGFANLREFSTTHKHLLQRNCGGAWQSYFQRGNWRMVFPCSRAHQESEAKNLLSRIAALPIAHIFTFPSLTINHGIMLLEAIDSEDQIEFKAYDPNITDRKVSLFFDKSSRTFHFPPTHYFAGGKLKVYQIYYGLFF